MNNPPPTHRIASEMIHQHGQEHVERLADDMEREKARQQAEADAGQVITADTFVPPVEQGGV